MSRRALKHVLLLAEIAKLREELPLRAKRGLWKIVIDFNWTVWCNPHPDRRQLLTEHGVAVPYAGFYVEYQRSAAGTFTCEEGRFVERSNCNSDFFLAALERRLAELKERDESDMFCDEAELNDFPDIPPSWR